MSIECDVLIIGGGPAGSTVAALLKKYSPELHVIILEREAFPRDHVGESQLPAVCAILNEMGAWDSVEACGFPVKIGSTYRWGRTDDLWHVNFLRDQFTEVNRPGKYQGQRAQVAFQVDRSIYDKVLLDHAASLGCEVWEQTKVNKVAVEADKIVGVQAERNGQSCEFSARYYVDASGVGGVLRKALSIPCDTPTHLKNIAFWNYWRDARWAETVGNEGTRVQILSVGSGWIWFIPITKTRTSVGLVLPSEYYKSSGASPETLYQEALKSEPRISQLLANATPEDNFQTTGDWNFVSERLAGENWLLVGDACGFADPILSAGMTLAQVGARKAAFSILEMDRGELSPPWIRGEYEKRHKANIRHHIRFAEFWYSANGCFTDLQEYCSEIAKSAGIELDPAAAFQWLGSGGFANDVLAEDRSIAFGFLSAKALVGRFSEGLSAWEIEKNNVFRLKLEGATPEPFAFYHGGRVLQAKAFRKGAKVLPLVGYNKLLIESVSKEYDATQLSKLVWHQISKQPQEYPYPSAAFRASLEVLEALIADGWIACAVDNSRPYINFRREGGPEHGRAKQEGNSISV